MKNGLVVLQEIRTKYFERSEAAAKRCLILEGTRGKGTHHADLVVGGHCWPPKVPKGHSGSTFPALSPRRLTPGG